MTSDIHSNQIKIDNWEELMSSAKKNGVLQFVYRYVDLLEDDNKPSSDFVVQLEKLNALTIRKAIYQDLAVGALREGLEKAAIDFLFFKGTVTKNRYPDPYLRSMGDIDLYYNPKEHAKFCDVMKDMGFAIKNVGRVHDIYVNSNGIVVEAHRQLVSSSSSYIDFADKILQRVKGKDDKRYEHEMSLEDEFLFNFVHLASHFKTGGIGIRFVIDVWIYKNMDMNWEYVRDNLSQLNLLQLYDAISFLSDKWFGQVYKDDSLLMEIEEYILSGGVFGNSKNQKNASIRNGRFKYFVKVCFPSFEEMQSMFPWLKSRILLPWAWLRRIFESLFKRHKNVKVLLNPIRDGDKDSAMAMKEFFKKCGLE